MPELFKTTENRYKLRIAAREVWDNISQVLKHMADNLWKQQTVAHERELFKVHLLSRF